MIDAERLLRQRGLAKRHISRRARLLHHTYTWHRILDESTYVLRSRSRMRVNFDALSPPTARQEHEASTPVDYSRLDDFLRLEPEQPPNIGEPAVEKQKDNESGLRDIHLEDSREFEGLFLQLYGVSETWLSLLSQTTRLANVADNIRASRQTMDAEVLHALEQRQQRLENKICAFAAPHQGNGDNTPDQPAVSMVRALSSALVIFFYRRVKDVNAWILQGHVEGVISALKEFESSCESRNLDGPGCPWPAFMAGCEALRQTQRDFFREWFDRAIVATAFPRFSAAKACMEEVWARRDREAQRKTASAENQSSSWAAVCYELNSHLLLS